VRIRLKDMEVLKAGHLIGRGQKVAESLNLID